MTAEFRGSSLLPSSVDLRFLTFSIFDHPNRYKYCCEMASTDDLPDGHQSGFPKDPSDFDGDPRVSYLKVDSKFILETDDGEEFEWDDKFRRWIPVVGIIRPFFAHLGEP